MDRRKIIIWVLAIAVLAGGLVYLNNLRMRVSKLEKKYARPVEERKKEPVRKKGIAAGSTAAPAPAITKRFKNPKVAIVIDDFGYNMNNIDEILSAHEPVTFSILPNLRYSDELARIASGNGCEVILHLPMEPHRKDIAEEADTINSRMSQAEVTRRLEADIKNVPGLKGVSNHMGSKATEEKELMTTIMNDLKKKNLYFFDSLTSEKSVCREAAASSGVRYAKRDIFLDNDSDADSIKRQVLSLRKFAFKNGRAIAICHDRPNTAKVLGEMMPLLASEGIVFVRLSEMEK